MSERLPSSYFEPSDELLCAVGSHAGDVVNAQICISLFSASIVPERPRIGAILWKSNLTHDLVQASGTFSLTILARSQLSLLVPLGLRSGHEGPKLAGLDVGTTMDGDPFFPRAVGFAACRVLDTLDLGDATIFVGAVSQDEPLTDAEPVTWTEAQETLSDEVMESYRQKLAGDRRWSLERMRW